MRAEETAVERFYGRGADRRAREADGFLSFGYWAEGTEDYYEAAEKLLSDARALEQAGAFAIVLEAIPPDLAARVTDEVTIPTIGIGAGNACDGQVLVCTDLLGMLRGHSPKFAKRYAQLGDAIVGAVREYVGEVQSRAFPAQAHAYKPNAASSAPHETRPSESWKLDEPLPLDHWH